jgi:hypothetical protein
MKRSRYLLICVPIILAGCSGDYDHHYPKIPSKSTESTNTGDVFNPLSVAELERVRVEIDHLSPYMTPNDCIAALHIPQRQIPTSAWGPHERQSISMQLRADHVLLLVCDGKGYVVYAQLDEKKWQWPKDQKAP